MALTIHSFSGTARRISADNEGVSESVSQFQRSHHGGRERGFAKESY